jgi:hypothetical protein
MTPQEAQAQFSSIVSSFSTNMTSEQVLQKQKELINLQNALPESAEYDPIATAIAEFSPKLTGRLTQEVISSLKSRDSVLSEASSLITKVANKANSDARVLTFEDPKFVVAALNEASTGLNELYSAAKAGNAEVVASKANALMTLIAKAQSYIKSK